MAIQEEDVQILIMLGLTISQARVYLALVQLEKAAASAISKCSKVARQEAYRILAELQEKGLVERIIASPTEFKPIPIEDCLSILIERKEKEISETKTKATRLLQQFKEKDSKSTIQVEESQFILVPEREAIVLRTTKALDRAQTNMDSIISWRKFSYLMLNARKFRLREALKRGVKIRFITEKPEDEKILPKIVEAFKKDYFFKVRYLLAAPSAHIGLYDKKEVFINTSTTSGLTETPLLWSNNPSIVAVVQDYFEIAWITAMESSNGSKHQVFSH